MRVLFVHNRYRLGGGEDVVVGAEIALLASRGQPAELLQAGNDAIHGALSQLGAAASAIYSAGARRDVARAIARFRPDVVHVHNFFPLLSPSVYAPCREAGVPVVQTLHNYRLLCPNGLFFRAGHPCEECGGRSVPWPGVLHGCYRESRLATVPVAAMLAVHRALRTWSTMVDVFIAPTEFVRAKFVQAGFAPERIEVKPHFVPGRPEPGDARERYALYVGRISEEKGIRTLLEAQARTRTAVPLAIAGEGPSRTDRSAASRGQRGVEWLGPASRERVQQLMRKAAMLVVPSEWYETFGLVIAEAFAAGLPVVAARRGAMAELVEHGRTGVLFEPGSAGELAAAMDLLASHPARAAELGRNARAEYERKYGEDRNYGLLMQVYGRALERSAARAGRGASDADERRREEAWNH